MIFAKVAVGVNIKSSGGSYTYEIPKELFGQINVGQIVLVPFRNKKIAGLVLEVTKTKPPFTTKKLEKVLLNDKVPDHLLKIIDFISEYYITSYGSALSSVIPLNLFTKNRRAISDKKKGEKKIIDLKELTPDQSAVFNTINESLNSNTQSKFLIFGVTGSGKTEIYAHLISETLKKGKKAIVLVPEISLTPQTFNYFENRFQGKVALWHSDLKETEKHSMWQELQSGKKTIVIGSRSAIFSPLENLGIIIIDEEQRFGVSAKEKLRTLRVNVDTLTLTATPIPRTLQFSLMGARDLSIINTPPPNRQPIITEVHSFNEEIIRTAIMFEVSRNGQVFFINNNIQNIPEIEKMINKLCPDIRTVVGHGQMKSADLENLFINFINGNYDVLISTTIVENGLDIPNCNTIIINNGHEFGLSDLYQLRGRVGRSNRRA
ncbi:hypothetical protein COZ22_03700, partial [bacterium (Candidatus Howlettbacteria) CG_4_10_14_3_um_filter_37_10]